MVVNLSGRELLQAWKSHAITTLEGTNMPRIIHQSWKSAIIPGIYGTLRKTWLAQYSDWTHVLWTEEDNAGLVRTLYPEYLDLYETFPAEIYRADMLRCLYMHTFGGIYVDLDFDSFKSLEPLLHKYHGQHVQSHGTAFLGRMKAPIPFNQNNENNSIPNAFLASTPRHLFWLEYLAHIKLAWEANEVTVTGKPARDQVEYISGPVVLRRAYRAWCDSDDKALPSSYPIVMLPPELVYPFAWYATGEGTADSRLETLGDCPMFSLEAAREKYDDGTAYMCTYWGESWREHGWNPQRENGR